MRCAATPSCPARVPASESWLAAAAPAHSRAKTLVHLFRYSFPVRRSQVTPLVFPSFSLCSAPGNEELKRTEAFLRLRDGRAGAGTSAHGNESRPNKRLRTSHCAVDTRRCAAACASDALRVKQEFAAEGCSGSCAQQAFPPSSAQQAAPSGAVDAAAASRKLSCPYIFSHPLPELPLCLPLCFLWQHVTGTWTHYRTRLWLFLIFFCTFILYCCCFAVLAAFSSTQLRAVSGPLFIMVSLACHCCNRNFEHLLHVS